MDELLKCLNSTNKCNSKELTREVSGVKWQPQKLVNRKRGAHGFSETMFSHVGTPIGKVVLEFNEPIAGAFDLLLILIFLRRFT